MSRSPIRLVMIVVVAAALSASVASSGAAEPAHAQPRGRAAPAAQTHTRAVPSAQVRIADGSKRPLDLLLPITDRGESKVEARAGSAFYRIKVSRDGPSGSDAPLRFEIERTDSQGAGRSDIRLSVAVRMRRGARAVLARLARPDGTTTTVTATLE